jgi:hypothetical protein
MLKQEDRERKVAEWLKHLQAWKESGVSWGRYAQEHEINVHSAYRWRARLIKQGLWCEEQRGDGEKKPEVPSGVSVRFARVQVAAEPRVREVLVRIELANGRRLTIEIRDPDQLSEVLGVLERSA